MLIASRETQRLLRGEPGFRKIPRMMSPTARPSPTAREKRRKAGEERKEKRGEKRGPFRHFFVMLAGRLALCVGLLQLALGGGGGGEEEGAEGACAPACPSSSPFAHLSQLKIAAPADGADVWGAFSVRVEFSHRVSPVLEPPEALPSAFHVLLNGDHALRVALKNSSRSFYLVHIPPLPDGPLVVQVALRFPGDDDPQSSAWMPPEQDRARYYSRGGERPIPELVPAPRPDSAGRFRVAVRRRLAQGLSTETQHWAPEETAILVVDMWRYHGCRPAMLRARELSGPVNRVISAARQRGVFIVHVPSSGVDEMAPDYPVQRARMIRAAAACTDESSCPAAHFKHPGQSVDHLEGEPLLPLTGGGCDDDEPSPPARWDDETHAQLPAIDIFPSDGLSESAQEIVGALLQKGIRYVVVMGVHANECLLKRPFGLRGLALYSKWFAHFQAVLARDLTDVLVNSEK
jgi:nicotinamidase-related amidase